MERGIRVGVVLRARLGGFLSISQKNFLELFQPSTEAQPLAWDQNKGLAWLPLQSLAVKKKNYFFANFGR